MHWRLLVAAILQVVFHQNFPVHFIDLWKS